MKDKLEPRHPFGHAFTRIHILLRPEIRFIEAHQEKPGSGGHVQPVAVLWRQQEQVSCVVIELIAVDAMLARTVDNIYQLEEIVPVRRFETFVRFFVDDFKWLVKVFRGHTP